MFNSEITLSIISYLSSSSTQQGQVTQFYAINCMYSCDNPLSQRCYFVLYKWYIDPEQYKCNLWSYTQLQHVIMQEKPPMHDYIYRATLAVHNGSVPKKWMLVHKGHVWCGALFTKLQQCDAISIRTKLLYVHNVWNIWYSHKRSPPKMHWLQSDSIGMQHLEILRAVHL